MLNPQTKRNPHLRIRLATLTKVMFMLLRKVVLSLCILLRIILFFTDGYGRERGKQVARLRAKDEMRIEACSNACHW
jgi:hypothetical protein